MNPFDTAINELNLAQCDQAIRLGYINLRNIAPDFEPELRRRIRLLEDRRRRLISTEAAIRAQNRALAKNAQKKA